MRTRERNFRVTRFSVTTAAPEYLSAQVSVSILVFEDFLTSVYVTFPFMSTFNYHSVFDKFYDTLADLLVDPDSFSADLFEDVDWDARMAALPTTLNEAILCTTKTKKIAFLNNLFAARKASTWFQVDHFQDYISLWSTAVTDGFIPDCFCRISQIFRIHHLELDRVPNIVHIPPVKTTQNTAHSVSRKETTSVYFWYKENSLSLNWIGYQGSLTKGMYQFKHRINPIFKSNSFKSF